MARNPEETRRRILDAAQEVVMQRGFAGASLDDIQARAGVSRGSLFHHFSGKDDLSRALIARYAELDKALTDETLARAERLSRDPLQQVLILVGLYVEMLEEAARDGTLPGCLFATYAYDASLFDEETRALVADAVLHFRRAVGAKVDAAIARHPPRVPTDGAAVADLAFGTLEGAMILSRILGEPRTVPRHLALFRAHLELLFGVEALRAGDAPAA